MYTITLEWHAGSQKHRQEINLHEIVDLGRHHSNQIAIHDKSVARRQAIIHADKNGVYLQCLDKNIKISMNSGPTLYKGDVGTLHIGTRFRCGTVTVRVVGLTHPRTRTASHYFPLTDPFKINYSYTAV